MMHNAEPASPARDAEPPLVSVVIPCLNEAGNIIECVSRALRVLDQNWFELSSRYALPREARNWIKELQTVRNKWAHLPSDELPASESFRDADTLGRLLGAIKASAEAMAEVEKVTMSRSSFIEACARFPPDQSYASRAACG